MEDRTAREEARLAALHRLGVLDTPPEERFDRVVRLAQQLFDVPTVLVSLVDRDRLYYKARVGYEPHEIPREGTFCSKAIEEPATLVVRDAREDPSFRDTAFVSEDPFLRFYAGQPLVAPGGHRVGTFCLIDTEPREFSAEDQKLLTDLASWVEKELVVEEELQRASQVQSSLLPRTAPDVPGYEVSGQFVPVSTIGGDFYDWQVTPRGLVLSLADVMGKGSGAAILAATVRAVFRAGAALPPPDALAMADTALTGDLVGAGAFVTAFRALLDPATGRVTYSDAGHGLTLIVRADGPDERLGATGLPLGVLPDPPRDSATVTLAPGDLLLTFSDGVLDAIGGAMEDVSRVADAVRGAGSADEAVDATLGLVADAGQRPDDLTVVAVRRTEV